MVEHYKKLALFLSSIFISFLILEIAVRILFPVSANSLTREDPYIQKIYHPNLDEKGEMEERSPEGEDVKPPHTKTNHLGFVGEEWSKEKQGFRIANLGDSYVAGLAVDYDKNFSALLGNDLSEKLGRNVESLNFGVQKQSTAHALETYIHYAREFDPDLVILWFDLGNDFAENLTYVHNIKIEAEKPLWKRIARKSELLYFLVIKLDQITWLKPFLRSTVLEQEYKFRPADTNDSPLILRVLFTNIKDNNEATAKTRFYLKRLHDEVASDGKKLLVAVFPQSFQVSDTSRRALFDAYPDLETIAAEFNVERPKQELKEILQDLSINYVDLTPDFSDHCKGRCNLYNVCTLCHFSRAGHILASEIVTEFIIANNLIKP